MLLISGYIEDREKNPKDWSGLRPTFQPAKRAVLVSNTLSVTGYINTRIIPKTLINTSYSTIHPLQYGIHFSFLSAYHENARIQSVENK